MNITINQWITLSFCLPQKAHQFHKKGVVVEPEAIDRCLKSLKPYHGMLLLVEYTELLDCVPPSGAVMLTKLLNAYNPFKTLQNIATDADFAIKHVYELVGHLVYWAKATVIYPLCETNVYVIAPDAPLHTHSPLAEKFAAKFSMNLFEVISEFSLPTSIGHLTTPLQNPSKQGTLVQMVLWMLQHHLLMQLHTYVQFMPTDHGECSVNCNCDGGRTTGTIAVTNGADDQMDIVDGINGSDGEHIHEIDELAEKNARGGDADSEDLGTIDDMSMQLIDEPNSGSNNEDDDLNAGSLLSMSSQPMPVPHSSRRSITDDHYSEMDADSTVSDNIGVQPSSSHKSNYSISQSDTLSTDDGESLASIEDEDKIKELLMAFLEPERNAMRELPAASNVEDLALMVKLWQAGKILIFLDNFYSSYSHLPIFHIN